VELQYHHITQDYQTPKANFPMIPSIVSEIVMKLLNWQPENRYQSASGLLADLLDLMSHHNSRDCLSLIEKLNYIESMDLSDQTPPTTFHIPKNLLRRGQDLQVFVSALEMVHENGRSRSIFVSGDPGIGRTVFLQEAEHYTNARHGFWVHESALGSDGVPYFTIARVLEKIALQLLEIDVAKRLILSDYLADQLGGIGKLLTSLAPSLVVCTFKSLTKVFDWKSGDIT
jgi:hypothetical protein